MTDNRITEEKRFAILIDAENISAKYVKYIMDEISDYGVVTYKRIYTDWTMSNCLSWKNILSEYAFSPMQQYSYASGKNSTDSAMIIDAMDILYSKMVDGFCIVSSDSDFTKLAIRLKESGMMVIGMGEQKTPKAFTAACNVFKYLDILAEEDELQESNTNDKINKHKNGFKHKNGEEEKTVTNFKTISIAIRKILSDREDDEQNLNMGELGNLLVKRYPDFDVRNYGYSKLSKLLQSLNFVEILTEKNVMYAKLKPEDSEPNLKTLNSVILQLLEYAPEYTMMMGELGNHLCKKFPNFDTRNYGYSKLSKLLQSLSCVTVYSNNNIMYVTILDDCR